MRHTRTLLITFSLCFALGLTGQAACSKAPPQLPPEAVVIWKANEAVVAVGTIQHVAIELNKVLVCDPDCHSLLSDKNTGIVVDAVRKVLLTIQQVPAGWKATALVGLDQIDAALDDAGKTKLKAYTAAARATISAL